MAESRTRRRIKHLECLIVENAKKVAEINAIKHRVNNSTALRQDQINLLQQELNLIIDDRNTAVNALNGVEKLQYIERTTSYENLKASILHGSEVENHLKPLLNGELDGMEKDLKNERLQDFDAIMFQRDWLYEPEFEEWLSGDPGDDFAHCKVCGSDFVCSSKSKVRSHGNGVRHKRLLEEYRRNKHGARTSYSGNKRKNNRSTKRSLVSTTSYSPAIQDRESESESDSESESESEPEPEPLMSGASYSSRIQAREISPDIVAAFSRLSPPQGRRQLALGREIAAESIQRNLYLRNDGAYFSERREFRAYSKK